MKMSHQNICENLLKAEIDDKRKTVSLEQLQIPEPILITRNSTVSRISILNFIENLPNDEKDFTNREILSTVHDIIWSSIDLNSKMGFLEKARQVIKSNRYHAFLIVFVVIDCICLVMQIVFDILFKENHEKNIYQAEKLVEIMSLFVLSLFMLSIFFHLILIPRVFLKSKLEIFDSIIVLISFCLEIISIFLKENVRQIDAIVITFRQEKYSLF